jgi:class 3 adenylate cyclase
MQRRLAAILAADVAGYSRLMAADETATLATLQRHIAEVWTPGIERNRGRIVKLMGDGILAEFASIVEAVDCAVAVQNEMAKRNAGVDDDHRIAWRVGVHLGDVYGDGLNVASRLEGIAEVGGVCISAATHEQIEGKLNLRLRPLGPQTLKNIARPVAAFAVVLGAADAGTESPRDLIFYGGYALGWRKRSSAHI